MLTVLAQVGAEVGDHGRDYYLLLGGDGTAHQVKLEGWGAECVEASECSPAALRKARSAARALARDWRRRWPEAGVVEHEDATVWLTTWAWNGPLSERGLASVLRDCSPEDVIDLRV